MCKDKKSVNDDDMYITGAALLHAGDAARGRRVHTWAVHGGGALEHGGLHRG